VSGPVKSDAFLNWLRAEGIIPENCRRVVIDATAGSVVLVYAELFGSSALIAVKPPPELRVDVVIVGDEPKPDTKEES